MTTLATPRSTAATAAPPPPTPRSTRPAGAVPDVLVALSHRARHLRQQNGLTLRALADRSGLSLRFLMDVEAGRGNISVRRLADLASALQTTAADLVSAHDDEPSARPIALLGLRGAGKTTVGRRLARRLRRRFVELDKQIEARAGLTLGEIFSLHGEDYYRRLERDTLIDLVALQQPLVVTVGGGLVTAPDTYALLLRQTTTIWLKARTEDYWNRVIRQGDRRPVDQHPQAREALRQLVVRREPLYARADITVDTSALTPAAAVERALHQLERPHGSGLSAVPRAAARA
jgi:XRE family transcriptional regulator, aerobic/anaerobic benzoate catabolism transcriptional regulator